MGEGATLTRAFRCVLLDPEWEKAREDQAIARIHRCGQKHNTQAYRLICSDGTDGEIERRHSGGRELIEVVQGVQSGELRKTLKPAEAEDEDSSDDEDAGGEEDPTALDFTPFNAFTMGSSTLDGPGFGGSLFAQPGFGSSGFGGSLFEKGGIGSSAIGGLGTGDLSARSTTSRGRPELRSL